MIIIDIILILFAFFAISRVVLRFKDKHIGTGALLFWTFVWLILILGVLFNDFLSSNLILLGFGRSMDIVVTLSLALLFYMVFRIYVKSDDMERNITELTREIAIQNRKKK